MRTTFRQCRIFIPVLILIFLTQSKLSGQTTCSTATTINAPETNLLSQSSSSTEQWYTFTGGTISQIVVWVYNDVPVDGFSSLMLYSGSCSSLTYIASGMMVGGDITLNYSAISNGTTYYLKASRATSVTTGFSLNVLFSVMAGAPCTCNPSTISPGLCEAVCNGGFDYHTGSLGNWNQLSLACPWSTAPNTTYQYLGNSTPDLFSATSTNTVVAVPDNNPGYQTSHSSGNFGQDGYAGIICYSNNNIYPQQYREYIEVQLNYPLVAGQSYNLSFWISMADSSGFSVKNIGAFLQQGTIYQNTAQTFVSIPAGAPNVVFGGYVNNTQNWVQITGTITALGGEDHLIIGQFTDNNGAGPLATFTNCTNGTEKFAYYFIDDVSLRPNVSLTATANPNPSCYGSPISITANCSVPNTTFTWSTSFGSFSCANTPCSTINTAQTNSTYTVSTTLPNYGCTISTTIAPTVAAGPTSANAGLDQNVCSGANTTLSGSGLGTITNCSWSILNGPVIATGSGSSLSTVVNPTTATSYVFTVTNSSTGCTKTDTMQVTVFPVNVQIVTPPNATTCAGNFQFTTTPNNFSSYSWSSNALSSSGQNTSTYTAGWGSNFSGIGSLSVTVTTSQGCTAIATATVSACCKPSTGNFNFVNDSSSHMNTSYPGFAFFNTTTSTWEVSAQTLSINGLFIVNANTKFLGCTIKMGPNAKVIVSPGMTLELTNLTLQNNQITTVSACSDMWDGIYVDGTNSATLVYINQGTVVEDAKNAVVSTKGGKFIIDGFVNGVNLPVKMNKNNIAVLVKPYAGIHPGIIRNTIISCDAPGQTGSTTGITYPGTVCRPPISAVSAYGVKIDSVNVFNMGDSTQIGRRNLFERTQIGVYSYKTTLNVYNNDFKYFTTTIQNQNYPGNGIAVCSVGKFLSNYTLTVGRAGNYKAKNKFVKCSYGVFARSSINLNCEYNRFDTCSSKAIYGFSMLFCNVKIQYDTLKECTGTNIAIIECALSNVTISNNGLSQNSTSISNFGLTGIYVANAVMSNCLVKIQNNKINKMRNGIWVTRVNRAIITDNTPINFINGALYTLNSPARGIVLQETKNSLVRMNTITSSIAASASNYDKIMGMYIQNSIGDTISKNTFTSCGSGIFSIGADNPILYGCNTFTNCYYGFNFGFVSNQNPAVGVSVNDQFNWNNNTPSPTGNSFTGSNKDLKGRITTPNSLGIYWYYSGTVPSSGMVLGSLIGNAPQPAPAGNNQCANLLLPITTNESTQRSYLLGGICVTPRTYDTLNDAFQYHDKVFAYEMLRDHPSWTNLGTREDSIYANFYTTQSNGNIGKFADVEASIADGDTVTASSILATITPVGNWEVNRKTVLGIFLQTWAVENFVLSDAQVAILTGIANQHPLTGGTSVVDARVMIGLEANDSNSVRLANPQLMETPSGIAISPAYPNPTSNQLSIDIDLPESQTGQFELFDLSGRLMRTWILAGGQGTYQLETDDLPAGTYLYRVSTSGQMILTDRLIIIRQ